MKRGYLSTTAKNCGGFFLVLCLAFPGLICAQPFSPLGPGVRITSPANHTTFYGPVDIPIFAYVRNGQGTLENVEFFAGTNDLGHGFDLGTGGSLKPIYAYSPIVRLSPRLASLYCLVWTNAPVGNFDLTVVARNATPPPFPGSLSRTSAPVNITILTSSTNTNPTDVVSIVATDPVAIAGTNSFWIWSGVTNMSPSWAVWPPVHWQTYTNWGPKNALFTIRRFGDASANLAVNLKIGGTASNGVDYASVTNSVTIPAGDAFALIPIVPIDNGTTNFVRTVIITLAPDTNAPPDYIVGERACAEAVILDNWRRPLPSFLPDGSFHMTASGPDGAWFIVQTSSDLQNWNSISTNQVFEGSIDFIDPDAANHASGFYRTVSLTNAPSN